MPSLINSYTSLKLNRLKQKNFYDIYITLIKRTPRYFRNSLLLSSIKNEGFNAKEFVPPELLSKELNSFNSNFIYKLSNKDKNEFMRSFNYKKIIKSANKIVNNKMEVFRKNINYRSGLPDWHSSIDIDSHWPMKSNMEINYQDNSNYGDPKYVWELNRFLHFSDLGRAFWLTENPIYSNRIVDELQDWFHQNQFMYGINWIEGMEVAIRAINWIFSFEYVKKSRQFKRIEEDFIISLYLHGYYIKENLSDKWRKNNNHIIVELVGLIILGNFFKSTNFGKDWISFASKFLIKELNNQVLEDGFIWESSTSYHKFVCELVFLSERFLSLDSSPYLKEICDCLINMINALLASIKPDGKVCNIGDSDDGYIMNYLDNTPTNPGFLKSIGISHGIKECFYDASQSEYSYWFNDESSKFTCVAPPSGLTSFPSSGLFFFNDKRGDRKIWCSFNAGNQNADCLGAGHRHADLLSIQVNINGQDLIIDGGTYKYYGTKAIRNQFKSTFLHSTSNINGTSQIQFKERFETARKYNAKSKILDYSPTSRSIIAEHDGYLTRYSTMIKRDIKILDEIEIIDSKNGKNNLPFNVNYLIPDEVNVERISSNEYIIGNSLRLVSNSSNLKSALHNSYCSQKYGELTKCLILTFTTEDHVIYTTISFEKN